VSSFPSLPQAPPTPNTIMRTFISRISAMLVIFASRLLAAMPIAAGLQGFDFIAANTDAQALIMSKAERIIIFLKRDPRRKMLVGRALSTPVGTHRKRRSIVPLITLFVPGYFMRCSPT
jgi:hypothetical protein